MECARCVSGSGPSSFALKPVSTPTLLLAALGLACFINFGRNRTLHCGLTGPLFLIAAVVALFIEAGVWEVNEDGLWGLVLVGVALAFLIEWWAVGRHRHNQRA